MLSRALGRPTLLGQAIGMLGSLGLVALLTRGMTSAQFGTYSIIVSMFAFAYALVGTTLGIRATRDSATTLEGPILISGRTFLHAIGLPVVSVVVVCVVLGQGPLTVMVAASAIVAIIAAEIAQGIVLGRRLYALWTWSTCWRTVVSVLGAGVLVTGLPATAAVPAALLALGLAAVTMSWRCWRAGVARLGPNSETSRLGLSGVGVINLALWVMSTGDRMILGWRAGLSAVALYAVIYGLLDRALRAVAVATAQSSFPVAMALRADGTHGWEATDACAWSRHRGYWLGTAALAAVLSLASGPFVAALSGDRYQPPFLMALLLSTGISFYAAAMPFYVRVIASDRTALLASASVGCAVFNLLGNALIDGRFGAMGAAVMTLLAYGLWAVAAAETARRVGLPGRGTRSVTA